MAQTGFIVDELIANPDLVEVGDEDVNDEEDEDESNQDWEEEEHDDDEQDSEDEDKDDDEKWDDASDDDDEDDDKQPAEKAEEPEEAEGQPQPQPQQQQPATSLVQKGKKGSGHLHETDMRVDPPLLEEGKKSIAEAEKVLEEQKAQYDKFKHIAVEKELAFHAAARVSKAARENRAKAEDRYYIGKKAARKAMRYAENMAREAMWAAARQAAADKFNEVIATANKESTAKTNSSMAAKLQEVKKDPKEESSYERTQLSAIPVSNASAFAFAAPVANATAAF